MQRKRTEQAQSEFVSLVSHQLRTPIAAMRLALEALPKHLGAKLSPDDADLIAHAQDYGKNMAETIHTMLSVVRLEAGTMPFELSDVSVPALLRAIETMYAREIQKKKLVFSVDSPKSLTHRTDGSLLKEAVGNLISNAIQYTPEGGTICVRCFGSEGTLRITVTDSGCGIPQRDLARVFTKFFRADNAKLLKTDGTGLGLYLVHSIVKLLGGTISFTSQEKRGTMFTIELPARSSVDTYTQVLE